jgi:hypothetical protein
LAGLDDIERTSAKLNPKRKGPMLFKGVLDVCDVVATDVGGADIHLFLEASPVAPDLSEPGLTVHFDASLSLTLLPRSILIPSGRKQTK